MEREDGALPVVGQVYQSKERRSLGKKARVLEPAPSRHGYVRLFWLDSRRITKMRAWYFWDRMEEVAEDSGTT